MDYQIYKLRFEDEAEWVMVSDLIDPETLGCKPVHVTPTLIPEWDEETEERPEPIEIEGYHIDVILSDGTEVNDYIIDVDSPQHSFSGCNYPIAKRVPDESWLKIDIQDWLTDNSIEWDSKMLKAELLELV